ncbi:MAG: alpha/beta hydrolase [Variibacter sp.]|nr:alpha/beta hydrolase [Variibacter sp.]
MDLVSIPENPVPDGARVGRLRTQDGVGLRYAHWPAPPGRRGTVCIFQGRAEFIEKYFETVLALRARGFAAVTLDWRGQGFSDRALRDRRKGHVGDFAEYDRDLEVFMQEVVLPDCPPPFFALAHSMGGTILIRAAAQGRRWFNRTVVSAPMLGLAGAAGSALAPAAARWLRRLGGGRSYVPGGGATVIFAQPFEGNVLTSDPERYARAGRIVEVNPDVGLGSPTVAWLDSAFNQMAEMANPTYPMRLRHPLLLVGAGKDAVVSNAAIEQFGIRLRAGSHVMIPGARHEILMEQDQYRAQFWAAFDAFVPGSE